MADQPQYDMFVHGNNRIHDNAGAHWSEEGITAELLSVRNYKGNVVHLDIYRAGAHDKPHCRAVDWLRERGHPTSYTEFLKQDPAAHELAIFKEVHRSLHHLAEQYQLTVNQLRADLVERREPYPLLEGRIVAYEGLIAWLDDEIPAIRKEIAQRETQA